MTRSNDQGLVVTVAEASRMLRLSRNSTYAAIRNGDIRTLRIGRRLLIPRAALERLLAGEGEHRGSEE